MGVIYCTICFFSNLIGATLLALISFPIIKDNPQLIKSHDMIVGLSLLAVAFTISIIWRWASQWSMEVEVIGDSETIDNFFERAKRVRYITGAKTSGFQAMLEKRFLPGLRFFMKTSAFLILVFYLVGGGFVVASIGATDIQSISKIQNK